MPDILRVRRLAPARVVPGIRVAQDDRRMMLPTKAKSGRFSVTLAQKWGYTNDHAFADEGLGGLGEDRVPFCVRDKGRGGEEDVPHGLGGPFAQDAECRRERGREVERWGALASMPRNSIERETH